MKALHPQMTKGFLSPQLKEIDINDCYFQSERSMNKKNVKTLIYSIPLYQVGSFYVRLT